jgi:hypothetical protein
MTRILADVTVAPPLQNPPWVRLCVPRISSTALTSRVAFPAFRPRGSPVMCLRFVFLLITRVAAWLGLSRREEVWKTAEILLLRHQLAALQRRHPRRPELNWADRALLAALLGLIPKARRQGLRLLVTRTRLCAGIATSSAAAGPPRPSATGLADRRPDGTSGHWSDG